MELEPLSPPWWVRRLHGKIADLAVSNPRRGRYSLEELDAYYCGRPRYPWLPAEAQDEFYRLLSLTRSNVLGLVVDATAERITVEGIRVNAQPDADAELWRIWQANGFDDLSDQAILEALIAGRAYTLVAPNPKDDRTPLMHVEHPAQAIVEYVPGSGRRAKAAGLKVWRDDWTGALHATLYLPTELYKWQARYTEGMPAGSVRWEPRQVRGEAWPAPNPLGEVPLTELPNNPRMLAGGVSEIADVIPVQDRICKTLADRLMTQDYGAFPQKWAIGYPLVDDQGNEQEVPSARNRMVVSEIAETRFGQWEAAALDPYSAAKREDVKDIASRTRTPAQYLLGELNNVNGETLKAAESGLVSKVRQRMRPLGEGIEGTARLVRKAAGLAGPDESMETVWRNPEYRSEGELVDALTKMATLGVPQEVLWERWGATPPEIARWKVMAEEQAQRDPLTQIALGQAQPAG